MFLLLLFDRADDAPPEAPLVVDVALEADLDVRIALAATTRSSVDLGLRDDLLEPRLVDDILAERHYAIAGLAIGVLVGVAVRGVVQ